MMFPVPWCMCAHMQSSSSLLLSLFSHFFCGLNKSSTGIFYFADIQVGGEWPYGRQGNINLKIRKCFMVTEGKKVFISAFLFRTLGCLGLFWAFAFLQPYELPSTGAILSSFSYTQGEKPLQEMSLLFLFVGLIRANPKEKKQQQQKATIKRSTISIWIIFIIPLTKMEKCSIKKKHPNYKKQRKILTF